MGISVMDQHTLSYSHIKGTVHIIAHLHVLGEISGRRWSGQYSKTFHELYNVWIIPKCYVYFIVVS